MSISNNKEDRSILDILTHALLVLAVAILIVWALPGQTETHLHYEIGRPWVNSALIADFNFDVMRADSTISKERVRIAKDFIPFYVVDPEVEQRAIDDFSNNFTEEKAGAMYTYKDQIIRRLHNIYSKPVMSAADYSNIFSIDSSSVIRVSVGQEVTKMRYYNVLSEVTAYDMLFFDDNLAQHRAQLNKFNLSNYIRPNIKYDQKRSDSELDQLQKNVATGVGKRVEKGEKIIDHTLGQFLYVLILLTLFTCYLLLSRKDYFSKLRNILMLYAMITIFPIMVSLIARQSLLSLYILPFAMVPMLAQVFFDSRTAFVTHVTMVMISAIAVSDRFEFIAVQMAAGLAAIFALNEMEKRARLFKAVLMAFVSSSVMYYAIQLIQTGKLIPDDKNIYIVLFISGILLLITYPMMYLIEKTFEFTSNITLFELSDTNKDLLRRLSEVAPGTFQHSITVGNLASEIASRIGANGLLVRTGALYHDIGKMTNPAFFTENQANVNPHDMLTEKESAKIIISHVAEGQKLAEEYDLPDVIKNFILTHHGQGMAKYFYIKYKNAHPDEDIDTDIFTYPGPNPNTREQAILMMTDAVEAASRSLDEYNDETIRNLVNKLIDNQVSSGFFTDCPITFRDITTAKQVLVERLKNIYHTRIKYPELDKDEKKTVDEEDV